MLAHNQVKYQESELLTFIKNNPVPDYIIKWTRLFVMVSNKSMVCCQNDVNVVNSRNHIFSSLTVVSYDLKSFM